MLRIAAALVVLALTTHVAYAQVPVQLPVHKIHFDLSGFDDDGLYGPPEGLRAAAYEFCIPARDDLAAEVSSIDPSIAIFPSSPGRIGCTREERLCVGSTYQPEFRTVLANLAGLDYVARIELSLGE